MHEESADDAIDDAASEARELSDPRGH